jgi:hypothetical protein
LVFSFWFILEYPDYLKINAKHLYSPIKSGPTTTNTEDNVQKQGRMAKMVKNNVHSFIHLCLFNSMQTFTSFSDEDTTTNLSLSEKLIITKVTNSYNP